MNWVANRIPAKNCIFSSFFYSLFFICVLFYFSCPLLFCPLSLLWFVFPFLAFCFYLFLHCLHRKGDRYEIVKVGQKITFLTSIMIRSYRGRISKYCYISYNCSFNVFSSFLFNIRCIPIFHFLGHLRGFRFTCANIYPYFLGRLNPNQKPLPFLRVISSSGDTNKYWVTQNMYIAVLGSWSENNSFQAIIYQE